MNSSPNHSSELCSNRRRFPPGRTISTSSGERTMDNSYTLEPTRLSRSRSLGDNSLTLSDALLDISGSDRNSSRRRGPGQSSWATRGNSRTRNAEKHLFLAHQSTLPENNPDWRSGGNPSAVGNNVPNARKGKTDALAADTANGDAQAFLVFRRRKPSPSSLHSFS